MTKSEIIAAAAAAWGAPVIDIPLTATDEVDRAKPLDNPTSQRTYRVTWEIDVDARTPREAAEQALAIQRDPVSAATVFGVEGEQIDLSEPVRVWSAGWNVPGYLPDEEPAHFASWWAAYNYLSDELARAADDYETFDKIDQRVVDQFVRSQEVLAATKDGESVHVRIGNYLWWIESVILPEGEEPNYD